MPALSMRTPRPTVSHHTFLLTCREFGLHFLLRRQEVEQGKSLLHKAYFKGLPTPYALGKCRWEQPAVAHLVPLSTLRKALPLSRESCVLTGAPRLCREHRGLIPREPALGSLVQGAPCATPHGQQICPKRNVIAPDATDSARSASPSLSVCHSLLSFSLGTSVCPCL